MHLPFNFIFLPLRAARPGVRLVLFFGGLLGIASAGYHFQMGFAHIALKHLLYGLGAFGGVLLYEALLMLLDTEERE